MEQLIYLASPYSHKDKEVCQKRFEKACEHTADLMRNGFLVYSPIAHSHPLVKYGVPTDWQYWKRLDQLMISKCDILAVLMLDGWKESVGVQAEIEYAKELKIEIVYRKEI